MSTNASCQRMLVQNTHISVALNKANASADSASCPPQPLTLNRSVEVRGKPRPVTTDAAKRKTIRIAAIGEMRFENQGLGSQRERCRLKHVLVQNVNACRNW